MRPPACRDEQAAACPTARPASGPLAFAAREMKTGLCLACAVHVPLAHDHAPLLARLAQEPGTMLYFLSDTRPDADAVAATLVEWEGATVAALFSAASPEAFAALLAQLAPEATQVVVARPALECWTSGLRERFLPCTLTLHDAALLDELPARLEAGRACFARHGFPAAAVRLTHVFVEGAVTAGPGTSPG